MLELRSHVVFDYFEVIVSMTNSGKMALWHLFGCRWRFVELYAVRAMQHNLVYIPETLTRCSISPLQTWVVCEDRF